MRFAFIFSIILGLFMAGCICPDFYPPEQKCSDGTDYGYCSNQKPLSCQSGQLISDASACGCPGGYDMSGNSCILHVDTCIDGTMEGVCSLTLPKYCSNGVLIDDASACGCPGGQVMNGSGCSLPVSYNFTSYENAEPYYHTYCDKIDPYNLNVRKAAADAIRNDPGSYSHSQLFDIYDWVKQNIIYQNVPLAGIPYPPSETLTTGSGDCKNQAVLIASMIGAIGGKAKVVADPSCKHAYALVYFGKSKSDVSAFTQAVAKHYGSNAAVNYITSADGIWVIFDPAGGNYPGNTLLECSGNRTVYYMTGCLECSNQYPNSPYTFNGKCYTQCPSGTVSANQYACRPCSQGSYSCNNQCLTCPSGHYMATDCMCYQS